MNLSKSDGVCKIQMTIFNSDKDIGQPFLACISVSGKREPLRVIVLASSMCSAASEIERMLKDEIEELTGKDVIAQKEIERLEIFPLWKIIRVSHDLIETF